MLKPESQLLLNELNLLRFINSEKLSVDEFLKEVSQFKKEEVEGLFLNELYNLVESYQKFVTTPPKLVTSKGYDKTYSDKLNFDLKKKINSKIRRIIEILEILNKSN